MTVPLVREKEDKVKDGGLFSKIDREEIGEAKINGLEIQEIFMELKEDADRLLSILNKVKTDLILQNIDRVKTGLETLSFLAEKIDSNAFRLLKMVERLEQPR
jgi:hypothetical protein